MKVTPSNFGHSVDAFGPWWLNLVQLDWFHNQLTSRQSCVGFFDPWLKWKASPVPSGGRPDFFFLKKGCFLPICLHVMLTGSSTLVVSSCYCHHCCCCCCSHHCLLTLELSSLAFQHALKTNDSTTTLQVSGPDCNGGICIADWAATGFSVFLV